MSVVKSKRGQSKIEFEQIYFQLADNKDNLVEHLFPEKVTHTKTKRSVIAKQINHEAIREDSNNCLILNTRKLWQRKQYQIHLR